MGSSTEPTEPGRLRISDNERYAVAEVLRAAAGEGRIDLDELEERLTATYAAKTYADLVPITADLPAAGDLPTAAVVPAPRPSTPVPVGPSHAGSFALMSETKRGGPWQVGATHWAFACMGSVVLDLRQATFAEHELVITANALMGSVEVVVDPHTHVLVEGVAVMGEFGDVRSETELRAGPDSHVVRVRGVALMGAVQVRRREPPGQRRWLRAAR